MKTKAICRTALAIATILLPSCAAINRLDPPSKQDLNFACGDAGVVCYSPNTCNQYGVCEYDIGASPTAWSATKKVNGDGGAEGGK